MEKVRLNAAQRQRDVMDAQLEEMVASMHNSGGFNSDQSCIEQSLVTAKRQTIMQQFEISVAELTEPQSPNAKGVKDGLKTPSSKEKFASVGCPRRSSVSGASALVMRRSSTESGVASR